ncbi:MAG TPA: aspartate aminotransferase family protein [Syntrophomonas sp.]|jgi:adenosylmethionine-8-amino-7-oxononanoate aminotransferase|nr:aspartate aminotransferase family protein [Syntrophomonas sp.]
MINNLLRPHGKVKEPIKPLKFVKGNGHYIIDEQGNSYLNGTSCLWNLCLGYNKDIEDAIVMQLNELPYSTLFNFTHNQAVSLSKKLIEITDNHFSKAYFTCTGSEANELAIKSAYIYQNFCKKADKSIILSFDKAYHGTTYITMSASNLEKPEFLKYLTLLDGFESIYYPYCYRCKFDKNKKNCGILCIKEIEATIKVNKDKICAVLIEPVLGSAGNITSPPGFFDRLSRLCKENDILIIADEVATGIGRCGEMVISNKLGIEADIIVLSKGLSAGYLPMGAVLFSPKIIDVFSENEVMLPHASSQDGNPLACAAALATLEYFEKHDILINVKQVGLYMLNLLNERLADLAIVGDIRGLGLMIGIELVKDKATKEPLSLLDVNKIYAYCANLGLLVYVFKHGISLFPPLDFTIDEAKTTVSIIEQAIDLYLTC